MNIERAPDISALLNKIIALTPFTYVTASRIYCIRSTGAKSRARARIWSFPKIWQFAMEEKPQYVIEILSENFDSLSRDDKSRVLIHELMHIPKNFSGALVPHRARHMRIDRRSVEKLFTLYKNSTEKR